MKKYEADLVAENRGFTKKELLKMSVKKDKLRKSIRWNCRNEKGSRSSFYY